MAVERTFSIIKPDATERNWTGAVNAIIEGAGLRINAKSAVHHARAGREFNGGIARAGIRPELGQFMNSVVGCRCGRRGPIAKFREVMGATDSGEAAPEKHPRSTRSRRRRLVNGSDAPPGRMSREVLRGNESSADRDGPSRACRCRIVLAGPRKLARLGRPNSELKIGEKKRTDAGGYLGRQ